MKNESASPPSASDKAIEQLGAFERGYIAAALFSSTDDQEEPLDKNYKASDIQPYSLQQIKRDCALFQSLHIWHKWADKWDHERAGQLFWFTRNGHGVGFWEHDECGGEEITKEIKRLFPDATLMVGDDDDGDDDEKKPQLIYAAF